MYKFIQERKDSDKIIDRGLWKFSRHPNYLGEILFWIGLYFFVISVDVSVYWWMIIGPVAMIILFNVVSIPLMEKRNIERKANYREYKKRVSKLIPWIPKKD